MVSPPNYSDTDLPLLTAQFKKKSIYIKFDTSGFGKPNQSQTSFNNLRVKDSFKTFDSITDVTSDPPSKYVTRW